MIPLNKPNSIFDEGFWNQLQDAIARGAIIEPDALLYTTDRSVSLTSLSSSYVNLFPDFSGRPILIDTTGFTRGAIQIFWNKNGGAGTHALRIVNHADTSKIFYENTTLTNGENLDANFQPPVPLDFANFLGKLRIQVKGNGTDSPLFEGIRIYLRR